MYVTTTLMYSAIVIAIVAIVFLAIAISKQNPPIEGFPKMGDAFETSWYRTLGRECEPGLYKCRIKKDSGTLHYFCSKNKDCKIHQQNVHAELMKEPMSWFDRFV